MYKLRFFLISFVIIILLFLNNIVVFAADYEPHAKSYVKDKKKAIIMVGDSRTMYFCTCGADGKTTDFSFVYKNGGTISNTIGSGTGGLSYLKSAINRCPDAPVVLWLGFNGTLTKNELNKHYDSLMKSYPKTSFYVCTLGPSKLAGNTGYQNGRVLKKNATITEKYVTNVDTVKKETGNNNIFVIDMYKYIVEDLKAPIPEENSKKDAVDKNNFYDNKGFHYNKNAARGKMLTYIRKCIEEGVSSDPSNPNDNPETPSTNKDETEPIGENTGPNKGKDNLNHEYKMFKDEWELVDMPEKSKLGDARQNIDSIYNKDLVNEGEYINSNYIKEGISESKQSKLRTFIQTVMLFIALCLIEYSIILIIAYFFDIVNIFSKFSLLNIVTFGRIHYAAAPMDVLDKDVIKSKHVLTFKKLLIDVAIFVIVASVILSGFLFKEIDMLVSFANSLITK